MNEKTKHLFKSLNYTVTANFLVLGISIILNLVVPKFLGIADYGYWQLYVFYSSYVGFFHLGWIDGIYLKIGGAEYDDLDKNSLGTQLRYLFLFELFLAFLLSTYALLFVSDSNRQMIWLATSVMLVVANLKSFVLFVLQSTNRIKEYAKLSREDRYLYLIGAMCYLLLGGRNPFILIAMDVLSKLIVMIWGLTRIKDIVRSRRNSLSETVVTIKENILIGSNLMLGNIASMLILGVSRFWVERKWSIETFGKLSFALSISNMFMLFINSVSVVLYPVLRRTNQSNLPRLYLQVRNVFVPFTFFLMLFFSPIRSLLEWWLPEYSSSLFFMGILFPMIVYEGRVSLLVNTYLKTMREEKIILVSNVITVLLASFLSFIYIYIFESINLTVISITFSLVFRCILAETMLMRVMKENVNKENMIELLLVILFIVGNLFLSNLTSFIVYLIGFVIYIILSVKKIKIGINYFIKLMKSNS